MEFFPANSLDHRPDIHAFCDRWYVSHLLAMQERPLWPPAPNLPTAYRLLFLPTFQQPRAVRLTEASSGWRAVCKRSDGRGGYAPGRLVGEAERELSRTEAERFTYLVDRVDFWTMPGSEDSHGCDGSQAVLEGVRASAYHVVARWSPRGTPYAELVEFLLGLGRSPKYAGSFAELAERFRPQE